ncbi:unnamed protein product [Auanema sp. JU1783]|nr:unnamed protein product [Auanema sp. JU1783]
MKTVCVVLALAAVAFAAPREKRFTVGTISVSAPISGGNIGCVVTGNTLYINGLKQRELNSDEQKELETYQGEFTKYKDELKTLVAEKHKALQARISGKKGPASVESVSSSASTSVKPKPPTRPSFCQAEDTTQYVFEGCLVQANKVYVGREYARDLTEAEVEELKQYDEKQTAYSKQVQEHVNKQVKEILGTSDIFSALLGEIGGGKSQDTEPETTTRSSSGSTEVSPLLLEAPVAPNFCTAIL